MVGIGLAWAGYTLVFWGMSLALHKPTMAPLLYTAFGLGRSSY